jgi:hypothetical protein
MSNDDLPTQKLADSSSEPQASVDHGSPDTGGTSSSDNAPTYQPHIKKRHALPPMDNDNDDDDNDHDMDGSSKTDHNEEPFDDYISALAASHSNDPDFIPNTWNFDATGMLVLERHWSLWRDRGYRLKPLFFSMFSANLSSHLIDHLLPYMAATGETSEASNSGKLSTISASKADV